MLYLKVIKISKTTSRAKKSIHKNNILLLILFCSTQLLWFSIVSACSLSFASILYCSEWNILMTVMTVIAWRRLNAEFCELCKPFISSKLLSNRKHYGVNCRYQSLTCVNCVNYYVNHFVSQDNAQNNDDSRSTAWRPVNIG